MMSIDPSDEDESGDEGRSAGRSTPHSGANKSPSQTVDSNEGGNRTMDSSRLQDPHQNSTSGTSVSLFINDFYALFFL